MARLAFERGALVALLALVVYAVLAPAWFVGGDNPEFAALGAVGGAAHPPGYPLYVLWLRALSWLPGASPAHTAALATALLGAAAILVLHAACRAWGASPLAASVATAVVAVSPIVLRLHSEAEAFAMNDLVVALVLWIAADAGPLRGGRRAAALGLVGGLGLCDHLTCAFVAPVGIYGIVRAYREAPRMTTLGAALGCFVLGLVPYAYLFVAPDTDASWGNVRSFDELLAMVTRRYYGGPGSLSSLGEPQPLANLLALARSLGRAWLWAPALLGLAILGKRAVTSWAWRALAASWLLAGPVLIARFDLPPEELGLTIVQRFHVLPILLLAVPVACGVDLVGERFAPRGSQLVRGSVLAAVACVVLAVSSLPYVRAMHSPAVERGVLGMLDVLPPNAVVITRSDELTFGSEYAHAALGKRRDVVLVGWAMMAVDWYRARLEREGVILPAGAGYASVRLAEAALAAGRPVFVDSSQSNVLHELPSYPFVGLHRVLPRGAQPPTLGAIVDENKLAYGKLDLSDRVGTDEGFATIVRSRLAETWALLAHALERAGDVDNAHAALAIAHQVGPEP